MIGRTLSHYRITGKLGAGGMGEVYRAEDTRLGREVAIKVLPEGLADDPHRLARFDREARLLAALNHPHIAAIHGVEESRGTKFLIMELVEGETLADRMARGPLPVGEALPVARQIAAALEAAHEKGVVHRDLKPANVMVDEEGRVKVLDFGLAKGLESDEQPSHVSQAPTLMKAATESGVVLGTAAYMSPEQSRGKPVDRRADVWAFGVVLWEMLTATNPFRGETLADTLSNIIHREPDWSSLPAETPPAVRRLLRRCLAKPTRDRLRDAGDARIELDDADTDVFAPDAAAAPRAAGRPAWPWVAAAAAALLGVVAVTTLFSSSATAPASRVVRSNIRLPEGTQLAGFASPAVAISPDGSAVAFVAWRDGRQSLYVRRLDEPEARLVEGSDGAEGPFFSPDGRWVAFGAGRISSRSDAPPELKKVAVDGGLAQTVCSLEDFFGGSWSEDGTICFVGRQGEGLMGVPSAGGTPETLRRDPEGGAPPKQPQTFWPQVLPGGRVALAIAIGDEGERTLAVVDLRTGEVEDLKLVTPYARYVPTGHVLHVGAGGTLMAAPFSLERLALEGAPVPVLEGVALGNHGAAAFAVSDEGTAVYATGFLEDSGRELRRLVRLDARGKIAPLPFDADVFGEMSLAPDGTRLAIARWEGDLWVYDLARNTRLKLSAGDIYSKRFPLWAPDASEILFSAPYGRGTAAFAQPLGGDQAPRAFLSGATETYAASWAPDGRTLVVFQYNAPGAPDQYSISAVDIEDPGSPRRVAEGMVPQLSPDGRWLAYASQQSGPFEVYLQSFPEAATRILVSAAGGNDPRWSRDGSLLYYWQGSTLMSADVRGGARAEVGIPRPLFEAGGVFRRSLTPVEDGFLALESVQGSGVQTRLHLVQGWLEALKK